MYGILSEDKLQYMVDILKIRQKGEGFEDTAYQIVASTVLRRILGDGLVRFKGENYKEVLDAYNKSFCYATATESLEDAKSHLFVLARDFTTKNNLEELINIIHDLHRDEVSASDITKLIREAEDIKDTLIIDDIYFRREIQFNVKFSKHRVNIKELQQLIEKYEFKYILTDEERFSGDLSAKEVAKRMLGYKIASIEAMKKQLGVSAVTAESIDEVSNATLNSLVGLLEKVPQSIQKSGDMTTILNLMLASLNR